jgi:serine protease Do
MFPYISREKHDLLNRLNRNTILNKKHQEVTMKKQLVLRIAPYLLLVPGLAGCNALALPSEAVLSNGAGSPPAITTSAGLSKDQTLGAIETALENIYSTVNPSVVSIQVSQKESLSQMSPSSPMPFFFFRQPNNQPDQQPEDLYRHGAGSGFVWDKEGHIVTNNHVVEAADKISVTFADGVSLPAEVVGIDPDSDLAVLKVDLPAEQLHSVQLADSAQVKVGQLAVAIGNPFGLENTMTVGFISALGRLLPVSSGEEALILNPQPSFTIPDIIQTDAPINPGNSGGVLVNDAGEVIGVTAAIESPVRASAGVGFAIPAAIVNKVVPALITEGHYDHPWLGLSGVSLNPELDEAMNLEANQRGALIVEVTPDSPADKAKLHRSDRQVKIEGQDMVVGGDVIVAIDGQPVQDFDDLIAYLGRSTQVDQTVKLTVLRDGKEETVEVTLAIRPGRESQAEKPQEVLAQGPRLGIQGVTITPEIAEAMRLPKDQQGVLVEQIELGSPADEADLSGSYKSATMIDGQLLALGGDIITAVDGQPVTTLEELQGYIRQAKVGQELTLTVSREGKSVDVSVTLTDPTA